MTMMTVLKLDTDNSPQAWQWRPSSGLTMVTVLGLDNDGILGLDDNPRAWQWQP